ncbi:MAG: bifunctional metallophosphatase/5'-nucleotidase [Anaerolineae bacterium]
MGGVARRATAIEYLREQAGNAVLVLDAGNTLFGQRLAIASKGQIIVEAMNAMGYDAMAIGTLDLSQGIEVLKERAQQAHFAVLSCNLLDLNGRPIFTPYIIVPREGLRCGIVGVSEPEAANLADIAQSAKIVDPVESVQKYLSEIRDQSDVLIVLSHLGLEQDKALAQVIPEIDLIVGGRTRRLLRAPEIVGSTIIVQAGYDGEWLGKLNVTITTDGKAVDPWVDIIPLGPEIADHPELAALVARYNELYPAPTPGAR